MYNPFKKILKSFGYGRSSGITVGDIISVDKYSNDLSSTMNYAQLADSGYIKNYVSNKCIRATMQALGDLKFDILINGENIADKTDRVSVAFKNLVRDPNADYSWGDFIGAVYNGRTIDGSGYVYPEFYNDGRPMSIEYFRPDRVTKICSEDERIHSYLYSRGSRQQVFQRDEDGRFDLLEWRAYNPVNDINGLSSVRTAGLAIDGLTAAERWNKQILENGGKYSGIASVVDGENMQQLDEEELTKLENKFNQKANSSLGGWLISNAPLKIESMGLNASELDWVNGMRAYAVGIANSMDYPPFLLNLESTTFTNMDSAKLFWYEASIIPKANDLYGRLGAFYSRKLGMDVEFKVDLTKIVALFPRMIELSDFTRNLYKDGLISQNEGREKLNLEPTAFGDDLFTDQNNTPAFGAEPMT